MLTRSQYAAREAAEHKRERALFSFAIGKSNCHHGVIVAFDFVKGKNLSPAKAGLIKGQRWPPRYRRWF